MLNKPECHLSIKIPSYQYRIPMLKIRQSYGHFIFNKKSPFPGKTVFILRWGPDSESGTVLASYIWHNYTCLSGTIMHAFPDDDNTDDSMRLRSIILRTDVRCLEISSAIMNEVRGSTKMVWNDRQPKNLHRKGVTFKFHWNLFPRAK